ncbi:hypothetical protein [Tabrizicola sp.]|nr:hypothetical protein [Tabrizicola sp.]
MPRPVSTLGPSTPGLRARLGSDAAARIDSIPREIIALRPDAPGADG